jgi:hypothetical protein
MLELGHRLLEGWRHDGSTQRPRDPGRTLRAHVSLGDRGRLRNRQKWYGSRRRRRRREQQSRKRRRVLLRVLVFFLLRALVCDLRLDGSPVHALACAALRGLRRALLVVLCAVPLVFVFAGRWERDGRRHAQIVEGGMWGVWTWELEGGGKMF